LAEDVLGAFVVSAAMVKFVDVGDVYEDSGIRSV
jgi:hypothetical protein